MKDIRGESYSREVLRRIPFIIWLYSFYIKGKRQIYLHPWHLNWSKAHSGSISKPILAYLEMHLTDHCNLGCKGCSHFSPIAEVWFANLSEHKRDMRQLRTLFSNIEIIRLVGGEPLLHPEIEEFLYVTREYFGKVSIRIATNGLLLPFMTERFWEACKVNRIEINCTVYPPFVHKKNEILDKVELKGIIIKSKEAKKFRSILNLKGDSNPDSAFKFCRSRYFAHF
jgi:uncharacterized radical SAM superfamily Fe-S cluster-containing enzyme